MSASNNRHSAVLGAAARLAALVFLHRRRRPAGTGGAAVADRDHPADPVHVPRGLSLSMAAAARQRRHRRRSTSPSRVYAFWHFWWEFEDIAIYRQGSYTREDFICGLLMFLLVMELSRLAHPALFWINLVLVFYTLYGYLSPFDFFWHPGTIVLPRRDLQHGRDVDRHLRHLRTDRADRDRGLPAAGGRRPRLRRAERDDQRDATPRRTLAPDGAADRGARLARRRHHQRQRLGQCGGGRHASPFR